MFDCNALLSIKHHQFYCYNFTILWELYTIVLCKMENNGFTECKMNNYIVRSHRDVIVITKFAITKFATRRASKAKSIVMY